MADLVFKINIETEAGKKLSYFKADFAETTEVNISASVILTRVNALVSQSYASNDLAGTLYPFTASNNQFNHAYNDWVAASVDGSVISGSIKFEHTDTLDSADRLKRYRFYGTKVCNVLGFPAGQWQYPVNFQLDDTGAGTNYFSGDVNASNLSVARSISFSPISSIAGNIRFNIDKSVDKFIQFTTGSAANQVNKLLIGYDTDNDKYQITGVDELTADNIYAATIKAVNIQQGIGGGTLHLGTTAPSIEIGDDTATIGPILMMGASVTIYENTPLNVLNYAQIDALRVGTADTDPGDGRLYVEDYGIFIGGVHVGGTSNPGTANLLLDGDISFSRGEDRTIEVLTETGTNAGRDLTIKSGDTSSGGDDDGGHLYLFGGLGIDGGSGADGGDVYIAGGYSGGGDGDVILAHTGGASRGKVGINDTSPSYTLDVNGDIRVTDDLFVNDDITVTGHITGGGIRGYFDGGESGTFTATRYLDFNNGTQMGNTIGYRMHRAGSITGVSCQFNVTAVSPTIAGTALYSKVEVYVRNDGTSVFNTIPLAGSGASYTTGNKGSSSTQAIGEDTFTAGDVLTLYVVITNYSTAEVSSVTCDDFNAFMEITFDT